MKNDRLPLSPLSTTSVVEEAGPLLALYRFRRPPVVLARGKISRVETPYLKEAIRGVLGVVFSQHTIVKCLIERPRVFLKGLAVVIEKSLAPFTPPQSEKTSTIPRLALLMLREVDLGP